MVSPQRRRDVFKSVFWRPWVRREGIDDLQFNWQNKVAIFLGRYFTDDDEQRFLFKKKSLLSPRLGRTFEDRVYAQIKILDALAKR